MRFLSTKIHGVLDYVMGALLIALPFILGYDSGAPMLVPVILGASMIVASLFTNYELGAVHAIPMPMHLVIDICAGLFLAVSPWLFNFDEIVWVPYLVLGLAEVGAGLMTEKHPRTHVDTFRPRRHGEHGHAH